MAQRFTETNKWKDGWFSSLDRGLRYLRTVIGTAAVYWGFDSMLRLATNISC